MHLIIPIATVVLLLCAGLSVLASPNHPTTPTYHIPATKSQYDHNPGNKHPSLLPIKNSNNSYCPPSTLPPVSAEQQRILFNDFVQILYVDRDFYKAFYTYVAIDSIVHDPFSKGQGRDVVIAALKPIWPTVKYSILYYGFDAGIGFVFLRAPGNGGGEPEQGVVDLYRFEGGCVVENWDVIQAVPKNATNTVGFF